MNPTQVFSDIIQGAKGLNDSYGETKLPPGFVPFAVNYSASGDTWNRRSGRTFFLLETGQVMMISTLQWDDGTSNNIADIGSTLYDLSVVFTYLVASGTRLIIQSPDLNYWDVTPNDTTGLINPTVVAVPAATPQVANFIVLNGESFGFVNSTGKITRLAADQDHFGWYLQGLGATTSLVPISTDLVFTVASGFSFRIKDYLANTWSLQMDNSGGFYAVTV